MYLKQKRKAVRIIFRTFKYIKNRKSMFKGFESDTLIHPIIIPDLNLSSYTNNKHLTNSEEKHPWVGIKRSPVHNLLHESCTLKCLFYWH